MNQKLSQLLAPSLKLYFGCLICFTVVTAFFSPPLALAEGLVVIILAAYLRSSNARRKQEMLQYIETVTGTMDLATKDTLLNAPLPMVIFHPDTNEVIWSNEQFLRMTGEREHLFDTSLATAVPDFDTRWLMEGKTEYPGEVKVKDRRFLVFGSLVHTDTRGGHSTLATTYWVDITEYSSVKEEFFESRPVVAILLLDNYEDAVKGGDEAARTAALSQVNQMLSQWVEPTGGLFLRYDRDRYLFLFEERYLEKFRGGKFSILDEVHAITGPTGVGITLSIGVGREAPSFKGLFEYASLSIEMALSRGGDQAVVKNEYNFEFYGGRSKEMEKRTKVKSRVMANTLGELVADSSRVYVMGHKFPDLDSIGAATGICALARKRGVAVKIVRAPGENPASGMVELLSQSPEYRDVFLSEQDALLEADPRTLLVVVDTNRPEQVQSQDLLECCTRVAVIDHHRRAASYIADAALNFHEPYASSASELVTELLQYVMEPADLLRIEAEALLAGIVLDTKNFTMRTGSRTFEAAAFLRRSGADTGDVRKLFQNDLTGTIARYDIIQNAKMYHEDIAVAVVDHTVGRITAAQAADELLNISGIDTSFVLFPDGDRVIISARSMGDTNVQVILEALGGGGNAATAGAQVAGQSLAQVSQELLQAIDQYFEDE
ncbi:MAG: DHH family phosphoesterase [Intestinimonas sp.]|jgi:c-di-AMP phosphodiesterase-like protein|nr:DHH family phosphoesterase [Intestinimonas sp.]